MSIKKSLGFLVIALAAGMSPAKADVIAGPTLNQDISGYQDTGLEFTALSNSILQGFVYQNQGLADTILLENATTSQVLYSLSTPAGDTSYTASGLNWSLSAGTDYFLLATTSSPNSNGTFNEFSNYPQSDSDIRVNYSTFVPYLVNTTQYWADFNNIVTGPALATPEPSNLIFGGLAGLAGIGYAWRRRRRTMSLI